MGKRIKQINYFYNKKRKIKEKVFKFRKNLVTFSFIFLFLLPYADKKNRRKMV